MATLNDTDWEVGKPNMGGLAGKVYGIPQRFIQSIPAVVDGKIEQAIVLKPGYKLLRFYSTRDTGQVNFPTQGEFDGMSANVQVTFFTPGLSQSNLRLFNSSLNGPWVFFGKDTDGQLLMVGDLDFGAQAVAGDGGSTGQASTDRRGIRYTFGTAFPTAPPIYNGGFTGLLTEAPVAAAASTITAAGFDANWAAVTDASEYAIDVSTSPDFKTFVSGYQGKVVQGLTDALSGLNASTKYYYRVRARYLADGNVIESENSNVIVVTTLAS